MSFYLESCSKNNVPKDDQDDPMLPSGWNRKKNFLSQEMLIRFCSLRSYSFFPHGKSFVIFLNILSFNALFERWSTIQTSKSPWMDSEMYGNILPLTRFVLFRNFIQLSRSICRIKLQMARPLGSGSPCWITWGSSRSTSRSLTTSSRPCRESLLDRKDVGMRRTERKYLIISSIQ